MNLSGAKGMRLVIDAYVIVAAANLSLASVLGYSSSATGYLSG